jgi:ACS family hexuronate transporter-like MFS transporter
MAEGPLSTTTNKIIDSLYPADKKTSIVGISASGTPLGAAASGPIVGFIAIKYGWKLSFVFIMFIGFIWAFLWWKYIKANLLKAKNNNEEIEQEIVSTTKIQQKLKISFYLKQKVIIAAAVAFFAYNYILFFFLTWFPHYLITGRNFSLEMTSIINIIPWTLGFIALASGGIVSDFIMGKLLGSDKDPLISRKVIIGFGLLISAIAVFLVEFVDSNIIAISLASIAVFFLYLTGSVYWGVIDDIVDTSNVGSAGGVMHGFGNCAGILGPLATGFIIHFTGNFMAAFILAGIIGFIGSSGAFLFIRRIKIDKEKIKEYIAVK